jgi:hypothetical protein
LFHHELPRPPFVVNITIRLFMEEAGAGNDNEANDGLNLSKVVASGT